MRRNPLYSFKGADSTGIYNVPIHSTVHILDVNASGSDNEPMFIEIIGKIGVSPNTTIGQFLLMTENYIDFNTSDNVPSEVEKIVEGSKQGWRLLGRDPRYHGNIGQDAIDLTKSAQLGSGMGATGDNAFAAGKDTQATGEASVAMGLGTTAVNRGSVSLGRYNFADLAGQDVVFKVGVGTAELSRATGFEVHANGQVYAREMSVAEIAANPDGSVLINKDYLTDPTFGFISKSEKGQPNGIAPLTNLGKVDPKYMDSYVITNSFVVTSDADMLASPAGPGDIVINTGAANIPITQPLTYINNGRNLGTMQDYTVLLSPTDVVQSINGEKGPVQFGMDKLNDVDLLNIADGRLLQYDMTTNPLDPKWKAVDPSSITIATTFTNLLDTPSVYNASDQHKLLAVNAANDGVEFVTFINAGTW